MLRPQALLYGSLAFYRLQLVWRLDHGMVANYYSLKLATATATFLLICLVVNEQSDLYCVNVHAISAAQMYVNVCVCFCVPLAVADIHSDAEVLFDIKPGLEDTWQACQLQGDKSKACFGLNRDLCGSHGFT